ncbi:MAG: sarcosine oxidase subunit delta [Rhodomicrobium sp.]
MRIHCPYCGEREQGEFSYLGDASKIRPADSLGDPAAMHDYVYLRENKAGRMNELWYHGGGCHAWLIVTRDSVTHDIFGVRGAREAPFGMAL